MADHREGNVSRTFQTACIIMALASHLLHGSAQAQGQAEPEKQQSSQTAVQPGSVPRAEKPVARRQARRAPSSTQLTTTTPKVCGDCFVEFHNKSEPGMFTTYCGPQELRHRPCCKPKNCIKCRSAQSSQFLGGLVAPGDTDTDTNTDEPFLLPDRIITGPQVELRVTYVDPTRGRQRFVIPRNRDVRVEELPTREVESIEILCGNQRRTDPQRPDGPR
jgi:hypothetical protein